MERITYTMKDIIDILDTTDTTIRHYEEKGLINIKRDKNKYRIFTLRDLHRIAYIKRLKSLGFKLAEIKMMLDSSDTAFEISSFEAQKQKIQNQINDLEMHIESIDYDLEKLKLISNNDTYKIISKPNFRFYPQDDVDITKIPKSALENYAFEVKKDSAFGPTKPTIGYIERSSDIYIYIPSLELCYNKIYKINSKFVGEQGIYDIYKDDLNHLISEGYELSDDILGIKLFTMMEDNDIIDYVDVYIPVIKTK